MQIPPFQPRFPWYGAHLQTIRNPLRPPPRLPGGPGLPLRLPLGDGDVLSARLDRPPRPVAGRPAVLVVHGLGGCETSPYVLAASAFLTARGHEVVRLSLRGAGPSQPLTRGWTHAGRYGDLEAVVDQLELEAERLVVLGFSLGGNLVLNYVARGAVSARVVAAASVCAPIDMVAASELIHRRRNRLYHDYLLKGLKRAYLNLHSGLDGEERRGVERARTLYGVDDAFTAPHHGFASADDYYRRVSSAPHLAAVQRPTLLLTALNDPFIPAASYANVVAVPRLTLALSSGGGHLGFHGRHGLWHLEVLRRFVDAAVPAARGEDDERQPVRGVPGTDAGPPSALDGDADGAPAHL